MMLKRTSKIFASDSDCTIEVTVKVKLKRYYTINISNEASSVQKAVEDEITAAVFAPRFYARDIKFSGGQ
jgi:hypothetical protein